MRENDEYANNLNLLRSGLELMALLALYLYVFAYYSVGVPSHQRNNFYLFCVSLKSAAAQRQLDRFRGYTQRRMWSALEPYSCCERCYLVESMDRKYL